MTITQTIKRTLLLTTMLAVMIAASGVALAVSKACPSGTTEQNPCLGTAKTKTSMGNDTLIGTAGTDYIKALSGNDNISGGGGNDTTDGGAGKDAYSYRDGWGQDTVIDTSGVDQLNFSAVAGNSLGTGVVAILVPEAARNDVQGPNGEGIFASARTTTIEKVTGSAGFDYIYTGGAKNTLRPGPGTGGAQLSDLGGQLIQASDDRYTGFSASGYGPVEIMDYGGTADKLVLPFASTDLYFEAVGERSLLIMSSPTDSVFIVGHFYPALDVTEGRIEQIQFTDTTLSIGSDTQATTTTSSSSSAEQEVAALNEASTLEATEKEKRSKAAKKIAAEAKKKAQDASLPLLALSGGQR